MSSSVSYSDRLSDMPDEILVHILSFLPTPESVRTSVLSPRWRHLWRFVSAFHFDIKDPSRPGKVYQLEAVASEAVEKINQFIALRDAARSLLRFHLHIDCHFLYHKDPVSNWIRYAGSHGVRDMAVNIYRMSNPPPLSAFFGLPSVEALDLRHHTYHPSSMFPHHIQPSKLKALTLRLPSAAFADKCLEALLASCPDLQELTLHCGVSDKVVEITAPNLCRLSIIDDYCHCHQDSYLVKINCPTLEYLHLSSWVHLKRFQGKIPSLYEASMDLSYNAPHTTEQFPQILANFCTVTKLTLRLRPGIEVKVNPWYLVKRMNHFPIFRKLKHFKFIAEFGEDYIKHILLCFLMNSPNLSSIQLIGEPEGYLRFISKARERLRISAPLKVLDHLKIVSFRGISDEVKRSEVLKMLSKHVNEWERVVVIT